MNPPTLPDSLPRRPRWIIPVVAILMLSAAVPVALALGVWSCLRTGSDATALRHAAARASGLRWERQVEFSAGSLWFTLGRLGLGFAPLEPEALLALKSVRRAEVAVFQSVTPSGTADRAAMLTDADSVMTRRGWDRLVGVITDQELIAVYFLQRAGSGSTLDACVLVLNEENLVVVSAQTDLDPLLKLVERHLPAKQFVRNN